ncbi:MAG: hypothetical protein KAG34_06560 [Cocleimonas sp.]|nr:hypothetical protein [Cocleimonas sp.]
MSKCKKYKSRRTNKAAANKLSPLQLKLQALSSHHYKIAIQNVACG